MSMVVFCTLLAFSFSVDCYPSDCVLPFPRSYVVYHLKEQEGIRVDGKLDEEAWDSVSWTEDFIDIQGADWKKPRFRTHAKMRWDNQYLYIGAFLVETDVWANQTKHDSVFSGIAVKLKSRNMMTVPELHTTTTESYTPAPETCNLKWVFDISGWLVKNIVKLINHIYPHSFKFFRGGDRKARMVYKNWAQEAISRTSGILTVVNFTLDVFQDNDFEVFMDPDGDTHWYKEFEINAINTTWDLELNKPYLNGGTPNSSWEMPTMKSAIFVSGPINNPSVADKFWTVELALPFSSLVDHSPTASAPPSNKDQWRINFSRVEWHVRNVNGHYEKVPNVPEDNWVWSSQGAINMHLPERWGFIQFSTDAVNTTGFVRTPNWPVYSALVMLYDAEKKFMAVNGYFTANLTQLEIPASLRTGQCQYEPAVQVVKTYSFEATVKPLDQRLPVGHIRDDRLIWFTERSRQFELEV